MYNDPSQEAIRFRGLALRGFVAYFSSNSSPAPAVWPGAVCRGSRGVCVCVCVWKIGVATHKKQRNIPDILDNSFKIFEKAQTY